MVQSGEVTIHVYDEARRLKQDFNCEIDLLLSSMRYFKVYLSRMPRTQKVEISVHCDVEVFRWLLQYTRAARTGTPRPALCLDNCMPVLIASHFLQMAEVVAECTAFLDGHLSEVLQLPIDLACLPEDLLSQLAKAVSEDTLEALASSPAMDLTDAGSCEEDSTDGSGSVAPSANAALLQRLYKLKVGHLLSRTTSRLCRCAKCGQLFAAAHRQTLTCPGNPAVLQPPGGSRLASGARRKAPASRAHVADHSWKLETFLAGLAHAGQSWRSAWWLLWSTLAVFRCELCRAHFPGCQLACCRHHPEELDAATDTYPCCSQPAGAAGCSMRMHAAQQDDAAGADVKTAAHDRALLQKYSHLMPPAPAPPRHKLRVPPLGFTDQQTGLESDEDSCSSSPRAAASLLPVQPASQLLSRHSIQPGLPVPGLLRAASRAFASNTALSERNTLASALREDLVREEDDAHMQALTAHLMALRRPGQLSRRVAEAR